MFSIIFLMYPIISSFQLGKRRRYERAWDCGRYFLLNFYCRCSSDERRSVSSSSGISIQYPSVPQNSQPLHYDKKLIIINKFIKSVLCNYKCVKFIYFDINTWHSGCLQYLSPNFLREHGNSHCPNFKYIF